MRIRTITALSCCLFAAACAERPTQPAETPSFQQTAATSCPTQSATEQLVNSLFPSGADRTNVLSRYQRILAAVSRVSPPPDTVSARGQAVELIAILVGKYKAGALIGGQSTQTQATLVRLINGILCTVGLPQNFTAASLGADGATGFVFPNSQETIVVTQTLLAGMDVPPGSVVQPTIVTVQRLPDFPGPLLTPLDQYPIYYEFTVTPAGALVHDVVIGVCLAANATPPDLTRLRIAHNVAPFTANSIQILPLVPAPFIDCTNAPTAFAPSGRVVDLALHAGSLLGRGLASLVLPQRLEAKSFFGQGGVGGTTKEFSPFGSVDTLASINAGGPIEFRGPAGSSLTTLPSVILTTPTGQPMANIPVTFAFTSGTGTISGATTVTNSSGVATLGSWMLSNTLGCARLTATASMTLGSGLTGNPVTFFGCSQ